MNAARTDSLSRILRTIFQALAGIVAATPLLTTLHGVSPRLAFLVSSVVAGVVVAVTAVQVIAEEFGVLPAALRDLPALPDETGVAPAAVVADIKAVEAAATAAAAAVKATGAAKK